MSLPSTLSAIGSYVADAILNECGQPEPDRGLRYHGAKGMPEDCCTAAGYVVTSWSKGASIAAVPRTGTPEPGIGRLGFDLEVRYVRCWPTATIKSTGPVLLDDEWDAASETMAFVAECVARNLLALECGKGTELADATLAEWGCSAFSFVDVTPTGPGGGCYGVTWRMRVIPKPDEAS